MAASTDFVAVGAGGSQGIQPMDLGLTVQQTAPIDIKQFLDTTLVSCAVGIATLSCGYTPHFRLRMHWRAPFTAA